MYGSMRILTQVRQVHNIPVCLAVHLFGNLRTQIISHAEDLSSFRWEDVHLRCVSRAVKYNFAAFDRITDIHVQVLEPGYQVYGSSSWSYSQSYLS
jgi:hypothetical protein